MWRRRIRIVNWNARSIRAKMLELDNFLASENIDIGIITETRLSCASTFTLPMYNVVQRLNSSGGGVAILIKKHYIRYEELPDPEMDIIQAKGVNIYTDQGKITLFAVYAPQQCKDHDGSSTLFAADLAKLTNGRPRFLVAGDLNARHTEWGNRDNNKNGRILADHLSSGTSTIHFPDEPTFSSWTAASIIDVFLSDCRMNLSKPVTYRDSLGSDHFPVICELVCTPSQYCHRGNWLEDFFSPIIANVDILVQQSLIMAEETIYEAEEVIRRVHDSRWFDPI